MQPVEACYTIKAQTIAATCHRSIDPGSDQWKVAWGMPTVEGMSARNALGNNGCEASLCDIPNIGWPKGQQQTRVMFAVTQTDEKSNTGCEWSLTSTVITAGIQSLPHIRWIGGGATPTEIRGGYILAHINWLAPGPLPYWNASICGMHRPLILGHVGVMVRVERTKTNVIHSQIYVACDFPMVHMMWKWKIMGNKQLVHSKIRYYM